MEKKIINKTLGNEIDYHTSIEHVIQSLKETEEYYIDKGFFDIKVDFRMNYYGSRMETDNEYQKRLKIEKREKLRSEKDKEKKLQRERREYERLKKKFEK